LEEVSKPVPSRQKKTGRRALFLNCNCISPESPGRRLIEEIEFYFRLERACGTPKPAQHTERSAEGCPLFRAYGSLTHPAGKRPVFHDSVNLLTDSVKTRSKFAGRSEKFPEKNKVTNSGAPTCEGGELALAFT
jgi:hypothetical protein